MFEVIGGHLHRGVDPRAELALSSLPLQGFYAKHVAVLSRPAQSAISHFQPRSFLSTWDGKMLRYKGRRLRNYRDGFTLEMPQSGGNFLLVFPAKGMGWSIFAEADTFYRVPGRRTKFYVLTVADTSEAVIVTSSVDVAQKLAVPAYQRCWLGNCPAPLPGLRWRPLPHDIWTALFEESRLRAGAPALESDHYEWRMPDLTVPLVRPGHRPKAKSAITRLTINLGEGARFERQF
jgi:hypothetical protein